MAITIDGTDGISPLKASGQTQTTTGTAGAPAIASSSDTDSGFFFGTNEVNISTGGSTRATVDSSGRLLINNISDTSPSGYQAKLQLCDTSYQGSTISIRRDQNNAEGAALAFVKSRATSKGGSTILQDDDNVGEIRFFGADGTDANSTCAEIKAFIDGTPGSNDMPGRLSFLTTADGASSPTERMRINAAGQITTPNQPSFQAQRSGSYGQSGTDNFAPYNTTKFNRGSHYSTSTYRFTAPVAGHYLFFANAHRAANNFGSLQIMKNNSTHYSFTEYESFDNNAHQYTIAIVDLGVNDYVSVRGLNYNMDGNAFFGGYLLG